MAACRQPKQYVIQAKNLEIVYKRWTKLKQQATQEQGWDSSNTCWMWIVMVPEEVTLAKTWSFLSMRMDTCSLVQLYF